MSSIAEAILNYLLNHEGYIEAQRLAEELNVSTKTIYRNIKQLNEPEEVILAQRGLGFAINADKYHLELDNNVDSDEKRNFSIAIYLLFRYPKDLVFQDVADKFYLSQSALNSKIQVINQTLHRFNLSLVRRGGKIKVAGDEVDLRQALNYLLLHKSNINNDFSRITELFPSISEHDKKFIIAQLALIQEELMVTLVDPYILNIFSHLYILMQRVKSREQIKETMRVTKDVDTRPVYEVARLIIENVSRYTGVPIEAREITFLCEYLISLRYQGTEEVPKERLTDQNDEVAEFSKYIIANYPFISGVETTNLFDDLYGHIKPMLNRIQINLVVVNPLVDEIKQNYPKEFGQTRKVVNSYTKKKYDVVLSDDEISFLTLYIVKAIEETVQQNKVIIMCSSGIGTAQLIKTRIKKEFPSLDIVDVISSYSYQSNQEKYENEADFIISTITVPKESRVPVVVVSPLLNELDLRRIKAFIHA